MISNYNDAALHIYLHNMIFIYLIGFASFIMNQTINATERLLVGFVCLDQFEGIIRLSLELSCLICLVSSNRVVEMELDQIHICSSLLRLAYMPYKIHKA